MKNVTIFGAIAGDVIGSVYEFAPTKDYHFPLLADGMSYTDDSIMTIAVADWIMKDPSLSHEGLIARMRHFGRKELTPMGGYGSGFLRWLMADVPEPYNSWGNGSAMRVSPVGFAFTSLDETLRVAKISAEVTHNHPEGIKGAQATAAAIFLARSGKSKEEIRQYIELTFGYNLHQTCDEIRPSYEHKSSCQDTVPQAMVAFMESSGFEDAIRLTVSLGGDADTMGAITGAIASAYYNEVPNAIVKFAAAMLPRHMTEVFREFNTKYGVLRAMAPADMQCGITPDTITTLKPGEVFVFGSNLAGQHLGGAARAALLHFGAVMGKGVGLQGRSYAIPTMQGGVDTIRPYADQFISFAQAHPSHHFLVTPIGCGIAGFRPSEIAPLFAKALHMKNVSLPMSFIEALSAKSKGALSASKSSPSSK